jgi:hypothetical protein
MTELNLKALLKQLNQAIDQEEVHIEGNIKIPEIYLNKNKGIIQFSGRSLPENAKEIYFPVIKWIDKHLSDYDKDTLLIFKLEYFNTSSSRMFPEIMKKLKQFEKQGKKVTVEWHYPLDDEDILESGETFEELTNLTFEYFPYEA